MRRFLIATIAIFGAVPIAAQQTQPAAAQDAGTYRSPAGFVLDLPAGWVRAPQSAVEDIRRTAAPELTYEAVFQVGDAPGPESPFATLAWGSAPDWLTPEEFRRRWTVDDAQAQLQGRVAEVDTMRTSRVGARVGVPWWDSANRAAWVRAEGESTDAFVWTVVLLHPSGGAIILFQYYGVPGEDEEQVLAQLDAVIRSLRVD